MNIRESASLRVLRDPRPNLILLVVLALASCGRAAEPTPSGIPSPTAVPPIASQDVRFALIGQPRDMNAWELFDESGANYDNYAIESEYWPRLYHLAAPKLEFEALAADGPPSSISADRDSFNATVKLRRDLKWTDGSPFTADDIVFTINNARGFELRFDWSAAYAADYLARVEAVDSTTLKFTFKQKPNVGIWQYGILQAPIVQKKFWEPKLAQSAALLPDDTLRTQMDDARSYLAKMQKNVDGLTAQVTALHLSGQSDRKLEASLTGAQGELTFAQNNLDKLLAGYSSKIEAARTTLFAIGHAGEPTLGTWTPAEKQDEAWVNVANADFPFTHPHFERALYYSFSELDAAQKAFEAGRVDMILAPNGASDATGGVENLSGDAHFLLFNPANKTLADPALRQALACAISFADEDMIKPIHGYVLPGNDFWRNPQAVSPCADIADAQAKIERAVQSMKSASSETLASPLHFSLIVGDDALEVQFANRITDAAQQLGLTITVVPLHSAGVRYAVLSSGRYDMAIMGWNLSLYPGYLCEWFGALGKFNGGRADLTSTCEELVAESDMNAAQQDVFEIESILTSQLSFIPLYAGVRREQIRAITYPFDALLGGLGAWYGEPSYAMPSP